MNLKYITVIYYIHSCSVQSESIFEVYRNADYAPLNKHDFNTLLVFSMLCYILNLPW